MLEPQTEAELIEAIATAGSEGRRIAIQGGGSKAPMGRTVDAIALSMRGMAGVIDYDPAELVLTVRAGTPFHEVEELVAGERQMLAFDPFDHGPIFGKESGGATIGGVVAAGVAGSRRVSAGAARDHLLGFRAVSGRAEAFVAGAKVVKNVTGYDLPKLAAGSWGRLFALSEITLKILPRPEMARSFAIEGLSEAQASAAMAKAMGSRADVAAVAHLPAQSGRALTMFRLEGFGPSVAARAAMLRALLADLAELHDLGEAEAADLWNGVRTLRFLPSERPVWRVNIPPRGYCALADTLRAHGACWFADWAGGLVWIAFDGDPAVVRDAAVRAGGHAMLLRAPEAMRAIVPAFHPQDRGVAALEARLRRAFDPLSLFETGRF